MRAVVQRVTKAGVSVVGVSGGPVRTPQGSNELRPPELEGLQKITGNIDGGLCILLGVGVGDSERDAERLADKIVNLRIFEDDDGKMNRSLLEVGGGALIVSQFTLYGDCRKGRRPSFVSAASPEEGNRLYEYFLEQVKRRGVETACGIFQTHMLVEIVNDGPVTLILDTRQES
jgi:D-tyrosyl-tRNA(Tyr) deacylase